MVDLLRMEVASIAPAADSGATSHGAVQVFVVITGEALTEDAPIAFVSEGFLAVTGYEREALAGLTLGQLLHAAHEDAPERAEQPKREGLESPPLVLSRRDGTALPFEVHLSPLIDAGGRVSHVMLALSRTQRPAQDSMQDSAIAVQASQASRLESVGSLALGIAHDFNNMLSAILGFCGLALDAQAKDSRARADLEQALQAVSRATQLTRYLLAFASRQELEPKAVDVSRTILDLAPILSRLAGESIAIHFDLCSTQVVWIDPCQFEQAVVNLVVNARDAMPNGGTISVRSHDVDATQGKGSVPDAIAPGQYLCVSVTDDGVGMDAVTQSRIFEPFFTTKRPTGGSGLGLASVYGFVRQSNGHICVDSEVGQGTEFRIYFPPTKISQRRSSLPPPRPSGAVAKHQGYVLLFDRDDSVRHVAERILAENGFRVIAFESTTAAEERILRLGGAPDVLLTAVGRPHTVGLDLAERVKSRWPTISIVLMSGAADMRLIETACERLGAQFVQKPFSAASLLNRVQEAVRLGRNRTSHLERCAD